MRWTRLSMISGLATLIATASGAAIADEGKCLRVIGTDWASEQQSVDPLINNNVADLMRITTLYEKLVELDNGFQPKPVLAESWESNPDGSVWTIHLRKGVKWHDGHTRPRASPAASWKASTKATQASRTVDAAGFPFSPPG